MTRTIASACIIAMLAIFPFASAANATLPCLRGNKPYRLAGDTMEWAMTIAPGADCIQGLRWSTMQIYNVSIAEKPKGGDLVLVGPGFRYFANRDFTGTDTFTLVVAGKNRRDLGSSTVQVTISRQDTKPDVRAAAVPTRLVVIQHPEETSLEVDGSE